MYEGEVYPDERVDTVELSKALQYKDVLLGRFDEEPIDKQHHSYHLFYYSSHGLGKSIRVEQKNGIYILRVKCIAKEGWPLDCINYQAEITKEEWDRLERMISDFDFWTENQLDRRKDNVLDGYVYILEGNRPGTEKCGRKTYQFIGRRSPQYDKIGALCEYIVMYEDNLAAKYAQKK